MKRHQALPAGTRIGPKGRIELREVLGSGGMGTVYAAFDEVLQRRVAVKSIRHGMVEERRQRLLSEARVLSRLRHPNICLIHDVIEEAEHDHLVLELIDGKSLRKLRKDASLDGRARLSVAVQLAEGMAAAHEAGVAHGDLKPENVMVTRGGEAKILDFGLAREPLDPDASHAGSEVSPLSSSPEPSMAGTLSYMSPEQVRGEFLTLASDVYSLGLLLQELFTGTPPYDPRLPSFALVRRIADGEKRPFDAGDPQLRALVDRMTARRTAMRPACADVAAELHRIVERPRRRLRRRLMLAAVTVLLAVAVALASLTFLFRQERDAAQRNARAATAGQLDALATSFRSNRMDLSLLLTIEAFRFNDTLETRSQLLGTVLAHPEMQTFQHGHDDFIVTVAWSPDGRRLALASRDGTASIWDRASLPPVGRPLTSHDGAIWCARWSPDGERLLTASSDHTLRFWTAEGQPDGRPLVGHEDDVWDADWGPDGRTVVSISEDGTARLWDVAERRETSRLEGHDGTLYFVDWGPDGQIAAGGETGTTWLWDGVTSALITPLLGHAQPIEEIRWSADGRLATADYAGEIRIWDQERDGQSRVLPATGSTVTGIAWHPDGQLLAAVDADSIVRIWDVGTGRLVDNPRLWNDDLRGLDWSPDGRLLAGAGTGPNAILWRMDGDPASGMPLRGHRRWVAALDLLDARTLVSSGGDMTIRIWDLETGEQRVAPLRGHRGVALDVAASPKGDLVASAGEDGEIRLWDAATGKPHGSPLRGHDGPVWRVAWNHAGSVLASSGRDGTVRLWWPDDGVATRVLRGHEGDVRGIAWSPDGRRLASAGADGSLRFWNAGFFSTDSRNTVNNDEDHSETFASPPKRITWSNDGRTLAIATEDRDILLWDIASRTAVSLRGHESEIRALTWSPFSRRLASADRKVVAIWDVAEGRPIARLERKKLVLALRFTPSGTHLLAAEGDNVVLLDVSGDPDDWRERACRRAGRNLSPAEWERYVGPGEPYRLSCPDLAGSG